MANASDRHAAAALIARRARTLVMLTATPHSGDDDAFARLCGIGDIDRRFPLALFRRRRQDVGLAATRRTVWLGVRLHAAEIAVHDALVGYARRVWCEPVGGAGARLAMVVLLRRAASSTEALARSIERRLALLAARPASDGPSGDARGLQPPLPFEDEDEEPDAGLAAPGLADAADERRHLESILQLARAAAGCEGKLRVVRTLLRRTSEPAIVFTEYRDTLAILARELAAHGCEVLHGGLDDDARRRALERFTGGATRLLLATDAAGEGLNLHAHCRLVVHLELPWTPVRIEQRVGRVDRIGQLRPVHQMLLVAAGTPEESTVAPRLRMRSARSAEAFDAVHAASHDEYTMAEHILRGEDGAASESRPVALPQGVRVPDLRARAREEVERAHTARMLREAGLGGDLSSRPFASAPARQAARGWWAFRVSVGPSREDAIWETIVAAGFVLEPRRFTRAADVAAFLERARRIVEPAGHTERQRLLAGDMDRVRAASIAAAARERAIASELETRHARLASTLVQRGLFDRRLEHDAASRRQVFTEAMAVCRARLAALERAQAAMVAVVEPAFAILLP
jgi:hypothetical protein